jgi:hypothetical protein
LKKDETANPISTQKKKAQYPNNILIIGFKINFRFLGYYCEQEIDLMAGEIAINSDEDKIIYDYGKWLREAKDIVDHHVGHCLIDFSAQKS